MYYFAAFGPIGLPELLLIAMILVLLFGAKMLPKLSRGVGESVSELRKGFKSEGRTAEAVAIDSGSADKRFGRKARD